MNDLIAKAIILSHKAHVGQTRRNGITPYVSHPMSVAKRVESMGGDDLAQATAWLHDTQEHDAEHPLTAEELRSEGIPEVVIEAIAELTKPKWDNYQKHIEMIASSSNPIVKQVKIADILTNLVDNPIPRQIRKYASALLILVEQ